jgi:hypothetical protein
MRQLITLIAITALTCGAAYANCGEKDCGKGTCDKSSKSMSACAKKAKGTHCKESSECADVKSSIKPAQAPAEAK